MEDSEKVVMMDEEAPTKHTKLRKVFQEYVKDQHLSFIPTSSHVVLVERAILMSKDILDKRCKPGGQWVDLINPIYLTYNNKVVHSAIGLTPSDASEQPNKLDAYINMKLKSQASQNASGDPDRGQL